MLAIDFCFLHLPKTAGSTFSRILRRLYGARWQQGLDWRLSEFAVYDPAVRTAVRQQIHSHLGQNEPGAISGHFDFGVFDASPPEAISYTILRDPVERVVSLYRFVLGMSDHYLHAKAQAAGSLERFLEMRPSFELCNDQIRRVAGITDEDPQRGGRPDDRALAEAAKTNLLTNFTLFGLTERLDESLVLLRRKLALPPLYYYSTNITPADVRCPVSPAARRMIEEMNAEEITFYREMNGAFDELVRREGASFQWELWLFRAKNQWMGRWIRLRQKIQARRAVRRTNQLAMCWLMAGIGTFFS